MMAAIAPAFCAFLTLTTNPHVPRSTSATLPAMAAEFVNAVHPSVVVGPAALASSWASTTSPVVPVPVSAGPNSAPPAGHSPAIVAGLLMKRPGAARLNDEQLPTVRTPPGLSVPAPLIRSTVSPQMSEYDSLSAPGCHW